MAHKVPSKRHWEVITLTQLLRLFPDDATAERWFAQQRCWGKHRPHCGSLNVQTSVKHPTMPYHCRDCSKRLSVRTGTAMESSNLGFQKIWALTIYLLTTSIKGVSSMKYTRLNAGRGTVGKTGVVGTKGAEREGWHQVRKQHGRHYPDRICGGPCAEGRGGLHRRRGRLPEIARLIQLLRERHGSHSSGEYVKGEAHTNRMELFWVLIKCGYYGIYQHMSAKHLGRYVAEFAGRHNVRNADTIDQMRLVAKGMVGERLLYRDFTDDKGLLSGARS